MILRDKDGLTLEEFLAQYNPGNYPRPSMTADVLIFSAPGLKGNLSVEEFAKLKIKVLMIKRGGHPCLGQWAFPGGFVNPNETVTQAAYRELEEETGVTDVPLTQLYTFSMPGRDPRTWVMSGAYIALLNTDSLGIKAGDDADKALWFDVSLDMKKTEGNTNQFHITLANDTATLTTTVESPENYFDEMTCKVIDNDGLAFDHPKMLTCGIMKLLNLI